ncbi:hypothetical protein EV210_109206 [Anaerospora hongkongensis]|uniref:Uncharacterized protein n=1 Tax=Anaerospora hongkongensis TaxID=244830 RepID=A0A4R1PZN6_9FIRM|nr:hypothetical protein [Anaerospora hongkongensis]TCL36256.1 hypothetical protein EV210_109206 [Anaerospora hongkongensis]
MDLYLQFGYGMKNLTIDLSKEWENTNVILSPRDITPKQLEKWSKEFSKANVNCMFDPQCYFPKCDHKNLIQYGYWDNSLNTNLNTVDDSETILIRKINVYNGMINSDKFIIPGIMRKYSSEWFSQWKSNCSKLSDVTRKVVKNRKSILTLALPSDLLCQDESNIEQIIETSSKWDVDGYYIIAEPYNGQYLVDNPVWISNLMQLCAGLKLQNREVIVGYANQQLLSLSATKIDAIASGTYLNVRKFSNKFEQLDDIKRKSVWFYYPHALSEYKIPFLDVAYNNGILTEMKPDVELDNSYISLIFSGILPSSTAFNENLAFKHYLQTLKKQVALCSRDTFKDTIAANEMLLNTAERRIEFLEKNGVYAQARSFKDIVDVNRSALQRLQKTRGFMLEHSWGYI